MQLTDDQLLVLKGFIEASPFLSQIPDTPDGDIQTADLLNLLAVPDFYVWKSSVPVNELMTGGFDWTRVDNLTVGKARIWEWMTAVGSVNPSDAAVRAGFEACFSVEAGDQGTRQAIYNNSQKKASGVEKLFAIEGSGTGAPSTHHGVGPAVMGFEGPISPQDVNTAKNL